MDSTGALELSDLPERLLVVGGGYIGLELGQVYTALGSKVTLIEMTDGLLPGVDRDLVQRLARHCERLFVKICLGTKVTSLHEQGSQIEARFGEGDTVAFDRVLVAVGRRPVSAELGLETTRVRPDAHGFVAVDERCRTADPRIGAVGDVRGEPMLAHRAMRQGKVAAEAIAGRPAAFDTVVVPAVVFTDPEVAWCGLTEARAQREGRRVRIAKFQWAASGRAATLGRADGVTKLVADADTGRVLGVGIVGPGAGELIAAGAPPAGRGAPGRARPDRRRPPRPRGRPCAGRARTRRRERDGLRRARRCGLPGVGRADRAGRAGGVLRDASPRRHPESAHRRRDPGGRLEHSGHLPL